MWIYRSWLSWRNRLFVEEVDTAGRRASACANFLGPLPERARSRFMFCPAAVTMASAFTLQSVLRRNLLIPCHSFASANIGSTHTLRNAFSSGPAPSVGPNPFEQSLVEAAHQHATAIPRSAMGLQGAGVAGLRLSPVSAEPLGVGGCTAQPFPLRAPVEVSLGVVMKPARTEVGVSCRSSRET